MPEKRFEEFEVTAYDEQTLLQRLAQRPVVVFIYYCVLIGYGVFSITFDWLWVSDMLKYETGLVFGPPDDVIVAFLIVIASIGTLSFILEIVGVSLRVFREQRLMDEDLAEALTILLEEAPSITVSLLIAMCREIPISYYQLAKAGLEIFGSLFRFALMLYHYFNSDTHKWKGFLPWLIRTIITLVSAYNLVAACLVFAFTYTEPDGSFTVPGDIIEKDYGGARYFTNAGVFFSHPSFQDCSYTTQSSSQLNPSYLQHLDQSHLSYNHGNTRLSQSSANWIQADEIYNLTAQDRTVEISYYYNGQENTRLFCVGDTPCYKIGENCSISYTSKPDNLTGFDVIDLTFRNRPKTKSQVYGDILASGNFHPGNTTQCTQIKVDQLGYLTPSGEPPAQLQYFQMRSEKNNNGHFYEDESGLLRPYIYGRYSPSSDLRNVTDAWKTGFKECDMGGTLAPSQGVRLGGCP